MELTTNLYLVIWWHQINIKTYKTWVNSGINKQLRKPALQGRHVLMTVQTKNSWALQSKPESILKFFSLNLNTTIAIASEVQK